MVNILDRVKKLLAHAESAKELGSLAEAEAFMAKVEALMEEHNLSLHDIAMHAAKDNDKFAKWVYGEHISHKENLAGNRWRVDLIKMLCRHNMTGVILSDGLTFRVYGNMQNVEVTVWLYNFLSTRLLELAKKDRATDPEAKTCCRHTYLKNWLDGSIVGIECKINEQEKKSPNRARINEIIVYNDKALDEYLHKVAPGFKRVMPRSSSVSSDAGRDKGYETGKGMSLGARLGASKVAGPKLLGGGD